MQLKCVDLLEYTYSCIVLRPVSRFHLSGWVMFVHVDVSLMFLSWAMSVLFGGAAEAETVSSATSRIGTRAARLGCVAISFSHKSDYNLCWLL